MLRVLAYLDQTQVYDIVYEKMLNLMFTLSCDTSNGNTPKWSDSQMVKLTWGSGVIAALYMKLITLSSTESEHEAANDRCTLGIHAERMTMEKGKTGSLELYWPTPST